ncbi:hypothetical protein AVEN_203087-1 [Araneus ventricosus]|uniref:Uncharacterized protein n=1 Tax=Araneus ventricosus TaxID=182803 RepID=A0A4Y2DSX1_ARAVE|nr:hypothetical protein AVEN_203087-1 [Araneus ventricosus]
MWSLEGQNGYKFCCHDFRSETKRFSCIQPGVESVMTWSGFEINSQMFWVFCSKELNSKDYSQILENHLTPVPDLLREQDCILQRDLEFIHTLSFTKISFHQNSMNGMISPALSPYHDPPENILGNLAQNTYENGSQYFSRKQLTTLI